jgi:hypothetical protein
MSVLAPRCRLKNRASLASGCAALHWAYLLSSALGSILGGRPRVSGNSRIKFPPPSMNTAPTLLKPGEMNGAGDHSPRNLALPGEGASFRSTKDTITLFPSFAVPKRISLSPSDWKTLGLSFLATDFTAHRYKKDGAGQASGGVIGCDRFRTRAPRPSRYWAYAGILIGTTVDSAPSTIVRSRSAHSRSAVRIGPSSRLQS